MRTLLTLSLAPALPVLLVATALAACGGDPGDAHAAQQDSTSSHPSIGSTHSGDATSSPSATTVLPSPPTTHAPGPADENCDAAAVHNAIANSDAIEPEMTFEFTYLKCAQGYGWARIQNDGDGATAFFEGSGADIELLDLGTSVCPTYAGMPASIATELAPPGVDWSSEC